jgi:hypothetical protein
VYDPHTNASPASAFFQVQQAASKPPSDFVELVIFLPVYRIHLQYKI